MVLSLLLSACGAPPHRIPPIPPPTRALQDTPARDAQSRLLQEAHRAFGQERYRGAVVFFLRFVEDAPDSPRLAEVRWWLGRAYEQLGDYRAAMEQYRTIVSGMEVGQQDGARYEEYALRRLDELYQMRAESQRGRLGQLALRVPGDRLPSLSTLSAWFDELVQAGVTALLVDLEPVLMPAGTDIDMDVIRTGVAEAHRHGLLYWIRLDLHRGMSRAIRPEWAVRPCHGMAEDGGGRATLDVTNPAYQATVDEAVRRLSRANIDGLVLAARSADRFADECSEALLQGFTRSFGRHLTPDLLPGSAALQGDGVQERPGQFWRWAGWKARNYAQMAARLRKELRAARPTATLLTEIHPSTLTAPLQGLEQFGEDVAELAAKTGGWIVVRDAEAVEGLVLERLSRQIGTGGRVWVERTVKVTPARSVVTAVQELMAESGLDRWNVVIRIESGRDLP